jgi:DNA polymerase-3 subunit beta
MKATIERATLLRCLSHVQSVVERRNTIPILSNVLIEAEGDNSLKVMATDLDLQVVEHMDASVDSAGAITVSAHLLFDIGRRSASRRRTTAWRSTPGAAASRCPRCRATISP